MVNFGSIYCNGNTHDYNQHFFLNNPKPFFCKGTLPNITRNALVNCTELVSYDLIKEAILRHKLMSGKQISDSVSKLLEQQEKQKARMISD